MAKHKTKKEIPICENVRLLKCGKWGYIHNGKPIFKCADVEKVNWFSKWAKDSIESGIFDDVNKEILETADFWQRFEGETDVMPQVFDMPTWNGSGNNFESQMKVPKG